jgi:hypothetical protein
MVPFIAEVTKYQLKPKSEAGGSLLPYKVALKKSDPGYFFLFFAPPWAGSDWFNWNLGICDNPCDYGCKHGSCSECGGQHRAKELSACNSAFQAHRGKGPWQDILESGKPTGNRAKTT